jgi:large repetitive protein
MAACISFLQAAGNGMNQLRYTISTVKMTMARPVFVRLAFVLLMAVAGSEQSFADITNDATASGFYNGNPVDSNVASAAVAVVTGAPALEVTKVATPDTNVSAGTLVTYTYTVRNSGNQVVTNITLNDTHLGSGPNPVPLNETLTTDAGTQNDSTDGAPNDGQWSTLAPGDVITLTATYTITQNDVDTKQ